VDESVLWTILGELVVLSKETIPPHEIQRYLMRNQQSAAQCEKVVLPPDLVAPQATLHQRSNCTKELLDEHLQEWHSHRGQIGICRLRWRNPAKHLSISINNSRALDVDVCLPIFGSTSI
jgi:hypothetical protein